MSSLYINSLFSNQLWYVSQFHISSWKPFKCKLTLKESCNTIENWVTKVTFSVMCLQIKMSCQVFTLFGIYNEQLCGMFALRFNPSTFGILVSAASLQGGSLTFAQKLPCYFNGFFGNSVINFKLFHKC